MSLIQRMKNEKGIALVMVLILALIGLAIVSALLFMITQGTIMSGGQKFYRTAEEASYGGAELATSYLGNRGLLNIPAGGVFSGILFASGCNCGDPYTFNDNIDNITMARSDRCDKLCNPTANWQNGAAATNAQKDLDPTNSPDFQFTLGIAPATFTVFAKIVDTVQGNSDVGGLVTTGQLGGAGVVASNTGLISPPHNPYLYRLEVQTQATANSRERARL
ncbi:MAG: hypothetical protein Q8K68_00305, partial [Nitrospirota bacterium]|nr:hypothetical protein [Nitrospirota bacterium]